MKRMLDESARRNVPSATHIINFHSRYTPPLRQPHGDRANATAPFDALLGVGGFCHSCTPPIIADPPASQPGPHLFPAPLSIKSLTARRACKMAQGRNGGAEGTVVPRSQGWWWCCLTQQRSPPRWACCNDNQISIIIVTLAKCNTRRTPPPLHTHTHTPKGGGLYTCFLTLPPVADPLRRWWYGTGHWNGRRNNIKHCQHTHTHRTRQTSERAHKQERCGICSSTCKMHFTFSLGARGARAGQSGARRRVVGSQQQRLIFSRSSFCAPGFLFFPFVPRSSLPFSWPFSRHCTTPTPSPPPSHGKKM